MIYDHIITSSTPQTAHTEPPLSTQWLEELAAFHEPIAFFHFHPVLLWQLLNRLFDLALVVGAEDDISTLQLQPCGTGGDGQSSRVDDDSSCFRVSWCIDIPWEVSLAALGFLDGTFTLSETKSSNPTHKILVARSLGKYAPCVVKTPTKEGTYEWF